MAGGVLTAGERYKFFVLDTGGKVDSFSNNGRTTYCHPVILEDEDGEKHKGQICTATNLAAVELGETIIATAKAYTRSVWTFSEIERFHKENNTPVKTGPAPIPNHNPSVQGTLAAFSLQQAIQFYAYIGEKPLPGAEVDHMKDLLRDADSIYTWMTKKINK